MKALDPREEIRPQSSGPLMRRGIVRDIACFNSFPASQSVLYKEEVT
jgi:hypothetical protein